MRDAVRFALPFALVALLPSLVGIKVVHNQAARNSRTLAHLCSIDQVNMQIYDQAVLGYQSLGEQATAAQKQLIVVLQTASRNIRNDTSCPNG